MDTFDKLHISLRYFLIGKGYWKAVEALEFAHKYHKGLRKDGVTPEFQHQIEMAHYVRTLLPHLLFPEETLITVILHDVAEDYDVEHSTIGTRFGNIVGRSVWLVDKNGKTIEAFYEEIAKDAIGSIVKGADRMHNLQSMIGVFTTEKQLKYIAEAEGYFLPMLKTARRLFPSQEAAYENIKHVLTSQIELLKVINSAVKVA